MDWKLIDDIAGYHAYTRDFDQTVHIRELADDSMITSRCASARHTLNKLREDGEAIAGLREVAARVAADAGEGGAALVLLVDNSGSLRGYPIVATAAAAAAISQAFEDEGVSTEVLGHTTRSWKGGYATDMWKRDGRPSNPGRLSEIRRVIYKDFGSALDTDAVSGMCVDGLLKDNLDNEALQWAADRLLSAPQERKMLLVLADYPVPICDVTTSIQPGLLERHHRAVVNAIQKHTDIELGAVFIEDRRLMPDPGAAGYVYERWTGTATSANNDVTPEAILAAATKILSDMAPAPAAAAGPSA